MDATVVKANLDRLLDPEMTLVNAAKEYMESVSVVDDLTVEIRLSAPDAALPTYLTERAGAVVSKKALDSGVNLETDAVGAGPYRLVSFQANTSATYERFDEYWGDPAGLAGYTMDAIADGQTRLNGLRSGEFDASSITVTEAKAAEDAGLQIVKRPTLQYTQMYFNRSSGPLSDLNVRKAINHAIDREAICEAVYFGYCEPTVQPFFQDHWAGSPDIDADYYEYDPEKARELIAESSHPDGATISLIAPAALNPYPQLVEVLQSQLAEVGITVEARPLETAQLAPTFFTEKASDALLGSGGAMAEPAVFYASQLGSSSLQNPTGSTAEGVDELISEMRATLDQDARGDVVRQATALVVEDALNALLVRPEVIFAMQDDVIGFEASAVASAPYLRNLAKLGG